MSFKLDLMAVFELQVSDKLFVAAVVDILLVAAVDKLEVDIQVVDILAVASLADKLVNMVLDWVGNSELETSDQNFNIDFLIVGYLFLNYSSFLNALVYHSSGKHMFPAVTVNWLKMMDTTDSENDLYFLDYYIVVARRPLNPSLVVEIVVAAVEAAVVIVGVVKMTAVKSVQ
ncbi:hypothetical protein G9A89_009823 [Geosiphon pyriformis]|nr:hypothetical protein G9A89_009823 [Geosiphon pyriformis]